MAGATFAQFESFRNQKIKVNTMQIPKINIPSSFEHSFFRPSNPVFPKDANPAVAHFRSKRDAICFILTAGLEPATLRSSFF